MEKNKRGLLLVIISGFVFGVMPLAVTICCRLGALKETVLISRYLVLALVLLPFSLRQKGCFRLYAANFFKILILSAVGVATPLFLYSAYEFQSVCAPELVRYMLDKYPALITRTAVR